MIFRPSLRNRTDDELMQLLAEGNQRALAELYERYSVGLLRYFFRMLWKDESKAQDFLHDLFLKIITNPKAYHPGRPFSTWLYSVAHNMCKNEYRKDAFRKGVNGQDITFVLPLISDETEQQDLKEVLGNALERLDEDDRHLYALRFEVEMPLEDIARLLECPTGTIKSRLFHLKKKLAGFLTIDYPEKIRYGIQ
jgi:RNA polymerase sigma-70 factor, ECF subfamily